MTIESSVITLLSNKALLAVFMEIARHRSILFKEILSAVDTETTNKPRVDKRTLEDAVKFLKEAELIKERPAAIEDFNAYYVTADGLTAERQLKPLTF